MAAAASSRTRANARVVTAANIAKMKSMSASPKNRAINCASTQRDHFIASVVMALRCRRINRVADESIAMSTMWIMHSRHAIWRMMSISKIWAIRLAKFRRLCGARLQLINHVFIVVFNVFVIENGNGRADTHRCEQETYQYYGHGE